MIKPVIVTGFMILGIGFVLSPAGVSAKSTRGQQSAQHPVHVFPSHHRRFVRPYFYYPSSRYYYDLGPVEQDFGPPPVAKPAAEVRRECEPKTYTVPSADGAGESKITVVRC